MQLIDTHTHVQSRQFDDDRAAVLARAHAAGVACLIEVGYDLPTSRAAIALAAAHPHIYAVVGMQPNHAHEAPPNWLEQVRELSHHPKVVAIGEIGLDYYHNYAPHALQQDVFAAQLDLAHERHLPVVIHSREATHDTVAMLRQLAGRQHGIMHSFSGDTHDAMAYVEMGFVVSFSGPVTFAKATALHEAATHVPLESILVETDSPYLSPHPHRGKRNEPARVALVVERIAHLRGIAPADVAAAVWRTAHHAFALPHE